jgi:hypothetical protein
MPFPLPLDPQYRRDLVRDWLQDVADRVNDPESANVSWKIANDIYLSLPPGEGDETLELELVQARVKIDQT